MIFNWLCNSRKASIRTAQTESDADEIMTQIRTRLLSADPTKLCVIASPLFVDLLKGIGQLCDEYRPLVQTGVQMVKEFLLTPAPALFKLSKIAGQADYASLRQAAIETYTKLITLSGGDEHLAQTQLAQLSTKLLRSDFFWTIFGTGRAILFWCFLDGRYFLVFLG
mgnify:CR=1 FL=1